MARKILDSTLEDAYFNVIFQVALRCITFFLNAFSLRYISEGVLGVMNVRLLLLESTILFLCRDAFRRACLSQTDSHNWPQIINLVWLTVPLSIIVSIIFSLIWMYVLSVPSDDITTDYGIGVWSVSFTCVISMLSEPIYLVARAYLFIRFQVVIKSTSVLLRTLIFAPWIAFKPNQAVIAFSVAQIVSDVLYCLGCYLYFYLYIKENNEAKEDISKLRIYGKIVSGDDNLMDVDDFNEKPDGKREFCRPKLARRQSSIVGFDEPFPFSSLREFLPSFSAVQPWIHPNSARLAWSFLKQGVLKQVLSEGERYVMTLFSVMSFDQQGIYDVVNNLGSLAARILFRPLEDSLYFYFGQSIKRDTDVKDQNQSRMKEAADVLQRALSCTVSFGLVVITFGQSYSALLLYLYGGELLSAGQGPTLLRAHCVSVLLLGINGITECYSFSTMTAEELNKYNYLMAAFSIIFLVISWGLTQLLGGVGFIVANCCNMAARIIHSLIFINSKYKNTSFRPLQGLKPNKVFVSALVAAFIITKYSEMYNGRIVHFLIGGMTFACVAALWSYQERELVRLAINKWRERRKPKEE